MSVNDELTFFQRLQIISVLHACILMILFLLEIFFDIPLIDWWFDSDVVKIVIAIILWLIGPKIVEFMNLKV